MPWPCNHLCLYLIHGRHNSEIIHAYWNPTCVIIYSCEGRWDWSWSAGLLSSIIHVAICVHIHHVHYLSLIHWHWGMGDVNKQIRFINNDQYWNVDDVSKQSRSCWRMYRFSTTCISLKETDLSFWEHGKEENRPIVHFNVHVIIITILIK